MEDWREATRKRGNESLVLNYEKLTGKEIFFNTCSEVSYMSSYFMSRWQQSNDEKQVLINNGVALTTVKIGGRLYPVHFLLTADFSPMTLGQDFFQENHWKIGEEDDIETPHGKIKTEGQAIDTELAEKVYTAEGVIGKKGSKEEKIRKLHKYFGHTSGDGLWRVIRRSSNPEGYTKAEVEKICEECQNCQLSKRKTRRKKTSLPRSTAFNQVVTMDLKVHGDGTYILWMCDDATRLIKGEVINNKEPDTIIAAIDRMWITGHGMGPGMPEKYFLTDNGGEFLNTRLLNLCQEQGITLKKTGSYSPQQNGLNERNHGVTDLMVEKYMRDHPNRTMQEAVYKSAWARNSLINAQRGFSPFQLVFGRSPTMPGVSDCSTGALEDLTGGEISRSILYDLEKVRQDMGRAESDLRIKMAMNDRVPTTTNLQFEIGDQVVFREGRDGKNHDGRIVGFEGPIALIRWGNMDRRVPERELLPSYERRELIEEEQEKGRENHEEESSTGLEDKQEKKEEGQDIESPKNQEQEDELDTEIIPVIIPKRRGRPRKKKEIIPEIPERIVVREEKRRQRHIEENEEPTREVWSEDEEEETHMTKNKCLTLPMTLSHVNMWNNWGERFSGFVTEHDRKRTSFRIQEHGTKADIWVELDKLNYWEYCKIPNSEDLTLYSTRTPSPEARKSMEDDQE
jgi:transposase InsO family protein